MTSASTQPPDPVAASLPSTGGEAPPELHDQARVPAVRTLIEDIVADVFRIEPAELRAATRGRARIALARQVAMYIAHVGYGLTLTEVGQLFERDRTTVAHACGIVEQRRDIREFDRAVALLEQVVRALRGLELEVVPGAARG